jgi:glycolate oxidase FAD binding subunit
MVSATLDALRASVGADCIADRGGKIIASPRSTEELAAVTRWANNNKLAVEIAGAGTKRGWGNPVGAAVVISTAGLVGVRHHSWHDLTATVGAGTPWTVMQRALAMHNQQVALDPLWPDTASVGGIVAANDSGALRLKYGSLRDLIIGMTIVLADGTIAKSGGKVVKNVAGYDLHKLMIGAFGTLGVVAEVTFRLHPISNHTTVWTHYSPSAEDLGGLMMKVLDSQLSTQAMQLRSSAEGYALDVQLGALPEVCKSQIETLDDLARRLTGKKGALDSSQLVDANPFAARERLFADESSVVIKATMLPTSIATLSCDVVRLGGSAVIQASGIMFASFAEEAAGHALPTLYAYVDGAGDGSLSLLRAPRPLPAWAIPPWGEEKAMPLMHEIKRRFDPNRTLNPGRFLGGI